MAIVEEVEDEASPQPSLTRKELLQALRQVSAKLTLPEELLPTYSNEEKGGSSPSVFT